MAEGTAVCVRTGLGPETCCPGLAPGVRLPGRVRVVQAVGNQATAFRSRYGGWREKKVVLMFNAAMHVCHAIPTIILRHLYHRDTDELEVHGKYL